MSRISDFYPAGMDECTRNGMFGHCGPECGQFKRGECDSMGHGEYSMYSSEKLKVIVVYKTKNVFELRRMDVEMSNEFAWEVSVNEERHCITGVQTMSEDIFHELVLKDMGNA